MALRPVRSYKLMLREVVMRRGRSKSRCAILVLSVALGRAALAAPPARGDEARPQPAATKRLIRIGPQALVSVDERGNVSMVEELGTAQPSDPDLLLGVVGVMVGGVVGLMSFRLDTVRFEAARAAESP